MPSKLATMLRLPHSRALIEFSWCQIRRVLSLNLDFTWVLWGTMSSKQVHVASFQNIIVVFSLISVTNAKDPPLSL